MQLMKMGEVTRARKRRRPRNSVPQEKRMLVDSFENQRKEIEFLSGVLGLRVSELTISNLGLYEASPLVDTKRAPRNLTDTQVFAVLDTLAQTDGAISPSAIPEQSGISRRRVAAVVGCLRGLGLVRDVLGMKLLFHSRSTRKQILFRRKAVQVLLDPGRFQEYLDELDSGLKKARERATAVIENITFNSYRSVEDDLEDVFSTLTLGDFLDFSAKDEYCLDMPRDESYPLLSGQI